MIISRPSQKFGTEMPISDSTIAAWSVIVFCRSAASTPLTSPTISVKTSA